MRRRAPALGQAEVLLGSSLLAIACWLLLAACYPLLAHYATPHFRLGLEAETGGPERLRAATLLFGALVLCYVAGFLALERAPATSGVARLAVVALAAGGGLATVLLYPVGALDVFNYLVQLELAYRYGQNPYLVTVLEHAPGDPLVPYSFLPHVPLFYGPAWLVLSAPLAWLGGFDDLLRALLVAKLANLGLLLLAALAVALAQPGGGHRWLGAYLLLANPLVLFEGVGNAHNDVLLAALLAAALLARRRWPALAPPLLVLSALAKFATLVLLPLLLLEMLAARREGRALLLGGVLAVLVAVAVTLPFWAGGGLVAGLWEGLQLSQDMDGASLYSLLREGLRLAGAGPAALGLVQPTFAALLALGVGVVAWQVWRGRALERALVDALLLSYGLLSLLYPWYLIPVVALLALAPDRRAFLIAALFALAGLLYYPLSVLLWSVSGLPPLAIHLAQAAALNLPIAAHFLLRRGGEQRVRGGRAGAAAGAAGVAAGARWPEASPPRPRW